MVDQRHLIGWCTSVAVLWLQVGQFLAMPGFAEALAAMRCSSLSRRCYTCFRVQIVISGTRSHNCIAALWLQVGQLLAVHGFAEALVAILADSDEQCSSPMPHKWRHTAVLWLQVGQLLAVPGFAEALTALLADSTDAVLVSEAAWVATYLTAAPAGILLRLAQAGFIPPLVAHLVAATSSRVGCN